MRFTQWVRLRRRPPPPDAPVTQADLRRIRIVNMVLYAFVIAACAAAAAAAVYAIQASQDAAGAVDTAEAARAQRVADQVVTNRRQCLRQRESLTQLRTTKRIEATSNRILLRTIERLLAQPPSGPSTPARSATRDALTDAARELRANIDTLERGRRRITRLLEGNPQAPKGSVERRGIVCSKAMPGRPLQTG